MLNPRMLGIKRMIIVTHPNNLEKASEELIKKEGEDVVERMLITIYVFETKEKKESTIQLMNQAKQLMSMK